MFCKTSITLSFFILLAPTLLAQSQIDSLESNISAIEIEIQEHKKAIEEKQLIIDALKDSISLLKADQSGDFWLNIFKTEVYETSQTDSRSIETIYRGARLSVIDTVDNFFKIRFLSGLHGYSGSPNEIGFVPPEENIFSKDQVSKLTSSEIIDSIFDGRQDHLEGASDRVKRAIRRGDVFIGMERKWVIESLGYPDEINKTTTKYGVNEQFIYEGEKRKYLYIEDGVLTTIQD